MIGKNLLLSLSSNKAESQGEKQLYLTGENSFNEKCILGITYFGHKTGNKPGKKAGNKRKRKSARSRKKGNHKIIFFCVLRDTFDALFELHMCSLASSAEVDFRSLTMCR